ncbi:(Fe-S)-binding protein, partial [Candidatus Bathyarchaeota archaeon]|nr:(Fe-S)-binding protein [Candidatus Bathyarchaeota archaeon]
MAEKALRRNLTEWLLMEFGSDKVLIDPEDLYVYSFYGEFASKRHANLVAVLRRLSKDEESRLNKIAEASKVHIVRTGEDWQGEPDGPVLFVDSRTPPSRESLAERLRLMELAEAEGKRKLKGSTSLPARLVSSLRMTDGFRLRGLDDPDNGYCIMQPHYDGVETYSSKGRLLFSRGLLEGELPVTEKLVDSLYTCTTCGQCYSQLSLGGFEINNAIVRARSEVVKKGVTPRQAKPLVDSITGEGNPMGMPAEDRAMWYEELAEERPYRGNDVLYWPGCSTSYRLPGIVESTASVMEEAELDFGLLGEEEGCCGLVLYLLGLWDEAAENASRTVEHLQGIGVKRLVTGCAGCYYAFTKVYRRLNVDRPFEVHHTSQMMESLVREGGLDLGEQRGRYVWHDPCDLGRHCGVYEPPRNVLNAIPGLELVEPPLRKEHTLCCGGGGGLMVYDEVLAGKVAHQ